MSVSLLAVSQLSKIFEASEMCVCMCVLECICFVSFLNMQSILHYIEKKGYILFEMAGSPHNIEI